MSAANAYAQLRAVLATIAGVRVVGDVGQKVIAPPALVLPPPTLVYEVYFSGPSECTFKVPLVVAQDDRAAERLLALLPLVEQAVHDSDSAALTGAEPGSWGSPPLPCYLLTIEVAVR